ncbi:helix-turn-helix domain-containing protein [Streptomyces carpaticus]|uniref:Helix-turn-helix domain-containing protein n=1 Tax=Streptomyces carpaticus TaxID=285558 RepID=A0ABV4ZPK3_9ACTN
MTVTVSRGVKQVNQTSTVLGRRLGSELLRLRDAAGLKQQDAADVLSATPSKIVKMERGWVPVRDPDIKALYDLYGGTDENALEHLLDLARLDRERRKAKGWWQHFPNSGSLVEYISMEDAATRIRSWELSFIPGLLQIPEYTRALVVGHGNWTDPEEIDPIVEVRQKRQQRLHGDNALQVYALVWEPVLRQLVGGSEVMRRQLSHLLEVAELAAVRLQVLPLHAGAHPCAGGAFHILSFADSEATDVIYADTISSALWVENEEEGAKYRGYFDRTSRLSLSQHDSLQLIDDIRRGM